MMQSRQGRKRRPAPRGLLLDFYGTLVEEDDGVIARICGEIARASPLSVTPEAVARVWGTRFAALCRNSFGATFRLQKELERVSMGELLRVYRAKLDCEAVAAQLETYWARPTILPESKAVLDALELPMCLVTNIDKRELAEALSHTGLSFEHVVTSEDCRAYKPHPHVFEASLAVLGLCPAEALHVGDSIGSDVRGAKAAGIPVLWVNRKGRRLANDQDRPDYESRDLTALLDIAQAVKGCTDE